MGSVRAAALEAGPTLDVADGTGPVLAGAESRVVTVSGTAVEVSDTAAEVVSRGVAAATVSTGRRAVSLLATALSITEEGTVSTIGEAVASVSDTTAEAVSARPCRCGAESASAFGAYPRTVLVSSSAAAATLTAVSTGAFLAGRGAFLAVGLGFGAAGALASGAAVPSAWCSTFATGCVVSIRAISSGGARSSSAQHAVPLLEKNS